MSNSTAVQRAENAFVEFIDGPITAFFDSCVHCGLCAHACLFYEETGDPKYTPIYKLEPMKKVWRQKYTFWGKFAHALGLSKSLTAEDLKEWEPLLYDSCTMCGRCSMVCPVGNDITYMIRKAREAMVASGYAPEGLQGATLRAATMGSPMGIKLPALQAKIKHIEDETGLVIPMDVEGAEYLALLSSNEILMYPEYIAAIAKIFKHTDITWTLSSEAYEATNSGLQIGSSDIAGQLVQKIVDAAEQLKVKTIITPECGHAYTAMRWEGPNLLGKKFAFKVKHILEVLDELRQQGRLKTKGMENMLEVATEKGAKLVFSSTSDVYGKNHELPFSETSNLVLGAPTVRRWAYASSKMFDEHLCFAYQKDHIGGKYGIKRKNLKYIIGGICFP